MLKLSFEVFDLTPTSFSFSVQASFSFWLKALHPVRCWLTWQGAVHPPFHPFYIFFFIVVQIQTAWKAVSLSVNFGGPCAGSCAHVTNMQIRFYFGDFLSFVLLLYRDECWYCKQHFQFVWLSESPVSESCECTKLLCFIYVPEIVLILEKRLTSNQNMLKSQEQEISETWLWSSKWEISLCFSGSLLMGFEYMDLETWPKV